MKIYYDCEEKNIIISINELMQIRINIFELLEIMKEGKLYLIEALSVEHPLIENVVNQILHGKTAMGSSSSDASLNIARLEIAKNASDVAKKEIEKLEQELIRQGKRLEEISSKYWDLYHKRYERCS